VIVSLIVITLAAGSGYLVNRLRPQAVTTQTATVTGPPFEMKLPLSIEEYSRDANEGNNPATAADGKVTLSAAYSKGGQDAFIVVLARPYSDAKTFMQDANMHVVAPVEDGMCGISGDNKNDGCALMRDNTGILVVSTTSTSRKDLMALTRKVADTVAG